MSKSEKAIMTALCMVYSGSRILMQNRVKEDWRGVTFPGGHIEKAESFIEGIRREILEETGLTIHNPKLCGVKQFQTDEDERYVVLLFKANEFDGELVSSDEGEIFWAERDRLSHYALVNNFAELLSVFDNDDINEMTYEHGADENDWKVKLH